MNPNAKTSDLHLLSNFTHQVINPLNGVIGTLDNLIDRTTTGERAEQRLRSIRGQLECTVSLVRNLAFFAQYNADYGFARRSRTDKICVVPQLVIQAAMFYQEAGINNRVRIELRHRRFQNAVKGNPDLLRQVFMNIFDNGIKYGLPDSILEVRNWIQKTTGDLIIHIAGPSVGFSDSEDIFGLGTRGIAACERVASGTGLGLHICRLIVENVFEGRISAEHVRSTNITRFDIRLPNAFQLEQGGTE